MNVLIATKNQAKINGALDALSIYYNNFEIQGIDVPSNVSSQPINDEVVLGAYNRIKNLILFKRSSFSHCL